MLYIFVSKLLELDEEPDPSAEIGYSPRTPTSSPVRETPIGQPVTTAPSQDEPAEITRNNDENPNSRQDPSSPADDVLNTAGDEPPPNSLPAPITNATEEENTIDDGTESKSQRNEGKAWQNFNCKS